MSGKATAASSSGSSSSSSSRGVASREEPLPAEAGMGQAEKLMYVSGYCCDLLLPVYFSRVSVNSAPKHAESDKQIQAITNSRKICSSGLLYCSIHIAHSVASHYSKETSISAAII